MTSAQVMDFAAQALKYPDYDSFVQTTGLGFIACGTDGLYLNNKTDLFYASYARLSYIHAPFSSNTNPFLIPEILSDLKKKTSSKLKQQRTLASIKQKAIVAIKEFIEDSFILPKGVVETSDIEFRPNCGFAVAGAVFWYEGTIVDEHFRIHTSAHYSYKLMTSTVVSITEHFKGRTIKLPAYDI